MTGPCEIVAEVELCVEPGQSFKLLRTVVRKSSDCTCLCQTTLASTAQLLSSSFLFWTFPLIPFDSAALKFSSRLGSYFPVVDSSFNFSNRFHLIQLLSMATRIEAPGSGMRPTIALSNSSAFR
jgi:hypothetical protein